MGALFLGADDFGWDGLCITQIITKVFATRCSCSKDFLFMRFLGVNFSKWSGIQANAVARIFSPVVSFKPELLYIGQKVSSEGVVFT